MKLFVLIQEGDVLLGVYSSKKKARKGLKKTMKPANGYKLEKVHCRCQHPNADYVAKHPQQCDIAFWIEKVQLDKDIF